MLDIPTRSTSRRGADSALEARTASLEMAFRMQTAAQEAFDDWRAMIARHFDIPDRRRREAFAGFVLTAIQGGYLRGRAERSPRAFREAADWLGELAEREVRAR